MEQGLGSSNRVICVCSDKYNSKANAGASGVGYEKRIISSELLRDSSCAWVIPLVRNCSVPIKLPTFLSSLRYISFEDNSMFESNFYDLLRDLHDQSNLPPLGKNPFEHSSDVVGKIDEMIHIKRSLATSTSCQGKVSFNYISNSGDYTFGTGLSEFKTHWSQCGGDSIYAYSDGVKAIAFAGQNFNFDELDLEHYDFSSRVCKLHFNENALWVNKNGKILVTKITGLSVENQQVMFVDVEYRIVEIGT